jgi:hypothetical protein
MPVEDPDFSGDQVRHDGFRTFYEFIKRLIVIKSDISKINFEIQVP